MRHVILFSLALLSLLVSRAGAAELPPAAERKIDFARDVRPLLEKNCWSCHGEQKQEGGLRLDRKSAAVAGGDSGKAFVATKSAESRLIQFVAGVDPDRVMPPEGDRLSAEAIGVLRAWIDQGAEWPEAEAGEKNTHWSYQPLARAAPPAVKRAAWPRNDIDRFVLAKLEAKNLAPSPEADRYTLIRRLHLDLIGLPPSLEEVDAFVKDERPDAYERLVERLLGSKHFGERWGRHWLDMARYADSDGYEKDNPRPDAWRYRDWVIDTINDDLPFDQFTVEQLAGDLLPDATPLQRLATAFHRQTLTNTEGGTDQEQWRVEACFDRTETTGAVWLGLTVGCARCHTHKYDAISQREYYQLFAFFNNGDETTSVVPKSPEEVAAYAAAKAAHDQKLDALAGQLPAAQAKQAEAYAAWEAKTAAMLAEAAKQPLVLHALEDAKVVSDGGVEFAAQKDGSVLAQGANPEVATYVVTGRAAKDTTINALRLDVLADKSLPAKGPGRVAHGNFVLSEVTLEVAAKEDFSDAVKLSFINAKADYEQGKGAARAWLAPHTFDGQAETGWAISPQFGQPHWLVLALAEPLVITEPRFVRITLSQQYGNQHTIGRFKLALQSGVEPADRLPPEIVKLFAVEASKRSEEQQQALRDYFSRIDPATKDLLAQLDALKKQEPPKPEITVRVLAQRTNNPRPTVVFKRGEFLHPIPELAVTASGLATLPPLKSRHASAPADRLDLARWIVADDNPLTPRVAVNHIWRTLFGHGLVRSSSDFGVRGEAPTHPELLDYLAAEFIAKDKLVWSRKQLIKQIVLSATYRQASRHRADLAEIDPQNLLLARQNRLRVEGEIVRDISLAASGLLSPKIGGPSVFPPLPPGIAELSYAGNFKWTESQGEDRYRRGMYTFFKRTAPHPNLTTFDCPDANLVCIERQSSNTALQALISLNNDAFAETARALAQRVLAREATSPEERLTTAFRLCVARPPTGVELRELSALLVDAQNYYRAHPAAAKQLVSSHAAPGVAVEENAAYIAVARIVLNLDETITRE